MPIKTKLRLYHNDKQDREAREETTRRTSIHDTDKLTSGHSAPDFAHAHQPLKKLIHSSGHSVKKKSRKNSDKAEHLEGIQEKEGRENPDPPILEEEEEWSEEKPSSLPWRQAGDEEGTLAMAASEIPRYKKLPTFAPHCHKKTCCIEFFSKPKYTGFMTWNWEGHAFKICKAQQICAIHQLALFMSYPQPVPLVTF